METRASTLTAGGSAPGERAVPDAGSKHDERSTLYAFSALLAAFATGYSVLTVPRYDTLFPSTPVMILIVAGLFFISDYFSARIQLGPHAYTVTTTEVPAVFAIFLLSPSGFLLARLVGSGVAKAIRHKRRPDKLVFNLVLYALETVVLLIMVRGVFSVTPDLGWRSWPAIFLGTWIKEIVSNVAVAAVLVRLAGAQRQPISAHSLVVMAACSINCCFALVALTLYERAREALFLLAIVFGALLLAYRSYIRLRDRHARLAQLYDFAQVVSRSGQTSGGIRDVTAKAREMLSAARAEVTLLAAPENRDDTLAIRMVSGEHGDFQQNVVPVSDLGGLWSRVVHTGEPLLLVRGSRTSDDLREPSIEDAIIAPLRGEGGVVGTIAVMNRLGDKITFDEDDRILFETLASHAAAWFENGRLIDQLRKEIAEREHQAFHDALTDLPNRRMFQSRAESAIQNARLHGIDGAVLLLDLDQFKEVNDALGHHSGDQLLKQVAVRLQALLPQGALVARLGGDEFAILVPQVADTSDARAIGLQVLQDLRRPVQVHDLHIQVDASIGVAMFPRDGAEASSILQRADVAMYAAKSGKTGIEFYSSERDFSSTRRLSLLSDLRSALDRGQLYLDYQPTVDLPTGRVSGAEALVRWRHPVDGLVMPDEFIPLAEQTGLIGELTMHVLDLALAQVVTWRSAGLDLRMSVNLSVRNLLDNSLADAIAERLRAHGLSAGSLTLEITESGIMSDPLRAIAVLRELGALGARLAIDDFGTGQSSLAYLRELPVDEVKIDKCFVRNMTTNASDEAIVRSVIDLGRHLHLRVVAEGVENDEAFVKLRQLGCDVAQGYHISRPLSAAGFGAWLLEHGSAFGVPADDRVVTRHPASFRALPPGDPTALLAPAASA